MDGLKEHHQGGWSGNACSLGVHLLLCGLLCNSDLHTTHGKARALGGPGPFSYLCPVGRRAPFRIQEAWGRAPGNAQEAGPAAW